MGKSIAELQEFVKDQLDFYRRQADYPGLRNKKLNARLVEKFEALDEYFNMLGQNISQEASASSANYTTITPDDIEGLPQELLDELNLTDSDHAEFDIVNIIKKHGGTMSLDHLLIALYKSTGVVHKRRSLTSKLYRMVNKGLLFNAKDKRATYTTDSFSGVTNLHGQEDDELIDE